jgi:hypothetical protein
MEQPKHSCPECDLRAKEETEQGEMQFSVLLSLVPLMTITVFSLMGLL